VPLAALPGKRFGLRAPGMMISELLFESIELDQNRRGVVKGDA
jgi:hypothetical protein